MLLRECAWWACALLLAAAAAAVGGGGLKRADMSPMPFVMATRYGRSSPPARHLAPRNDRFFMSTRYGKRSDAPPVGVASGAGGGGARALLCEFTGVHPLFRCRHRPPAYRKRSAEEVAGSEEQ